MSDHPVGEGRDDRPPSARARAELSAGVSSEVADARLRLQEAVLRAEGHRLLGDEQGLRTALADQDRILRSLRDRLGRTTSAAVLQRDAEQVVAAAVADLDLGVTDIPVADDARVVVLDDAPAVPTPRHAPLLSGVASVVALIAVAGAIVLGTGQGPTSPGVLEVAGQLDEVERPVTPADTTTSPVPDRHAGATTERAVEPTPAPAGPTERAPATDAPTSEQAAEDDADDEPTTRTLERIVQELNEVVSRFGVDPSARTDLPIGGDEQGSEDDADADASTPPDDDDADSEQGSDEESDDGDEDDDGRRWLDGFVRGGGDE